MIKVILVSGSPRRRRLLAQIVPEYSVVESEYEEDNTLDMKPEELVLHHAVMKARDVASKVKKGIVIGADTVVSFEGEVLGKPLFKEKAIEMLTKISGKELDVISGICVIDVDKEKEVKDIEISRVKMKKLSSDEIESYVELGKCLDKAGAFAAQEEDGHVESITGSKTNVIGLPIEKLRGMLVKLENFFTDTDIHKNSKI